jgi:hypothetical protein
MKVFKLGGSIVLALCMSGLAYAHHSAAGIDQTKTVTAEGIVKTFKWANPHSWLEIEVQNSKGESEIWNLEMNPPAYLVRAGWKSSTVKPGDKIKFSEAIQEWRSWRVVCFRYAVGWANARAECSTRDGSALLARCGTAQR